MRIVLLCATFLIAACGDTVTRTQVMLVLDAESGVRTQTRNVQVVVRGGTGAMERWQERLDRAFAIGDGAEWPLEVALLPLNGDASRVYEATATATDANDEPIARVRAVSGYSKGKTLMLRLVFEDDCRDQVNVCGDTQTCRDGACTSASISVISLEPYKPGVAIDAGVDAADASDSGGSGGVGGTSGIGGAGGADAGGADAAGDDASLFDSGLGDAGTIDSGLDAAPPITPWCGTCDSGTSIGPSTCGTGAICLGSDVCQVHCECDFDDPSHCGIPCEGAQRCLATGTTSQGVRFGVCEVPGVDWDSLIMPATASLPMPTIDIWLLMTVCAER